MGIWIITNNMTFHTEGGFDFEQVLRPLLRIIIIITVIRPYRTTTIRKAGFGTRKPGRGKGFAMISDSWRISRRPSSSGIIKATISISSYWNSPTSKSVSVIILDFVSRKRTFRPQWAEKYKSLEMIETERDFLLKATTTTTSTDSYKLTRE